MVKQSPLVKLFWGILVLIPLVKILSSDAVLVSWCVVIIPECLVYILGKCLCWMVLKYTHSRLLHIIVICNNTKYSLHSSLQCILSQSYYNLILHRKLFYGGGGGGTGLCCLILPFSYSGYLSIKELIDTIMERTGLNMRSAGMWRKMSNSILQCSEQHRSSWGSLKC